MSLEVQHGGMLQCSTGTGQTEILDSVVMFHNNLDKNRIAISESEIPQNFLLWSKDSSEVAFARRFRQTRTLLKNFRL
jgi:hypothetical protein